jgi:predicted nucleic acid-binding Zn ribbon protein
MNHLHHFINTECAAYEGAGPHSQKNFCVHRDGACKLYGDSPARCRYLEEAVLPTDEVGSAKAEYALATQGVKQPMIAPYRKRGHCAYCHSPFTAQHNREMYCSDECREAARRTQVKQAVRRHRSPTCDQVPV